MHQIIIIIIAIVLYTSSVFSQSKFENELLAIERSIFESQSDTERSVLHLRKLDVYLQNQEFSEAAFSEVKQINYLLIKDTLEQRRFLWNAALVSMLNSKRDHSVYYIEKYTPDNSIEVNLLKLLNNVEQDSVDFYNSLARLAAMDSAFISLSCLTEIGSYQRKNKLGFIASSAIIPGLGSILNGNWVRGTNSLLLTGAMGIATYNMVISHLYFNSFFIGFTIFVKFYLGNLKLTERLFENKETIQKNKLAKSCKLISKNLLDKYPLSFKTGTLK